MEDEFVMPFKMDWSDGTESNNQLAVMASKNLLLTLDKWKKMKVSRNGKKYKPEEQVESVAQAITVLLFEKQITKSQATEISHHLLSS